MSRCNPKLNLQRKHEKALKRTNGYILSSWFTDGRPLKPWVIV